MCVRGGAAHAAILDRARQRRLEQSKDDGRRRAARATCRLCVDSVRSTVRPWARFRLLRVRHEEARCDLQVSTPT